jgi:hypothetical protein
MRHTQLNKELENMDIFVDIILRNSHTSTVLRQLYLCQYNVFLVSCFYGPVFIPAVKTIPWDFETVCKNINARVHGSSWGSVSVFLMALWRTGVGFTKPSCLLGPYSPPGVSSWSACWPGAWWASQQLFTWRRLTPPSNHTQQFRRRPGPLFYCIKNSFINIKNGVFLGGRGVLDGAKKVAQQLVVASNPLYTMVVRVQSSSR